jgi:hypothetical protein
MPWPAISMIGQSLALTSMVIVGQSVVHRFTARSHHAHHHREDVRFE